MKPTLTEADFQRAAADLGCQVAAIKAVRDVEAGGAGFNPDESIKLLFEGHHFHRLTGGKHAAKYPHLSYPKWTRAFYGTNQVEEHKRFNAAVALDPVAALLSTSFGLFQVMGFNHARCGFADAADMLKAFAKGEPEQLDGFVEFVRFSGLADELQQKRWADFARLYNGPSYAVNRYDTKLAAAFRKHGGV